MYSLVSPSLLCMDLIRHENVLGLVDVLDRSLALGLDDLPRLTAMHRTDPERQAAWAEIQRACGGGLRMVDAVAAVRIHLAEEGPAGLAGRGLAERLAQTPMFGLQHLLAMVRHDVLDWTWDRAGEVAVQRHPEAVSVVVDAVASAYARAELSVQAYARLGGPWAALHREQPSALPADGSLGPQGAVLIELTERLARFGGDDFARVESVAASARAAGADWSKAMHNATWAAYLAGRLRPVARAQLSATRSLALAGITPLGASCGVMRVVTAAVQALAVADLLDGATYTELVAPWESVYGLLG